MRKIIVTAEVWKEGNMFTAYCPELDVASCGHSSDEAKKNLNEVIGIQLEETSKLGTLKDFLADAGQDIRKI
jgi:predicted RNase H-like HicB family nuclease